MSVESNVGKPITSHYTQNDSRIDLWVYPINQYPLDVLQKIVPYLTKDELQTATYVDTIMRSNVITATSFHEIDIIKDFIHVLIQELDVKMFPEQRDRLSEISDTVTSQKFKNLPLLKKYILGVGAQLIDVIKTLDTETENNLKNSIHLPYFLKYIFELVQFERQIDEANSNPDETERGDALRNIIYEGLIPRDSIDRAIDVARSIPGAVVRGLALWRIYDVLIQRNNIDQAIDVAISMPNKCESGSALWAICKALMQADDIDRAMAVAELIPEENLREMAINAIYQRY